MNTHDIDTLLRQYLTGDGYIAADDIPAICAAIEADRQARGEPAAIVTGDEDGGMYAELVDGHDLEPGQELYATPQPQQIPTGPKSSADRFFYEAGFEHGKRAASQQPPEGCKLVPVGHDASVEAIQYALNADEGMDWLSYWNEGDFETCRRLWPDAPESCYIGADPMIPETRAMLEAAPEPKEKP